MLMFLSLLKRPLC